MSNLKAFQDSVTLLQGIIDQEPIPADALAGPTPCRGFDVRELQQHIIDTHLLLIGAAGGTDVVNAGDFAERHRACATSAVEQWTRRGEDGTVDLGGNDLPASFALALHTLECYVHGWDLAQALQRGFEPDASITEAAWSAAHMILDSGDARGGAFGEPYGSPISVAGSTDRVEELIGFTGRDPRSPISAAADVAG
jgi:uncharacterized protein (TIGR03086 family)